MISSRALKEGRSLGSLKIRKNLILIHWHSPPPPNSSVEILQGILIWRLFGGFKEYLFEPSGAPGGSAVKTLPAVQMEVRSLDQKVPWTGKCWPTPVLLLGKSRGQRGLGGYSLWGRKRVRYDAVTNNNRTVCRSLVCDYIWQKRSWIFPFLKNTFWVVL